MSTKPDDLDLEVIHEIANGSHEVKDLIKEKNEALHNIDKSQRASFNKPSPAPKPSGDIRISKTYQKETMSKENAEKLKDETKSGYDGRIKAKMVELSSDPRYGFEERNIEQIKNMPDDQLAALSEHGPQGYKNYVLEQEFQTEKDDILKDDKELEIRMDKKESKEIFDGPEKTDKSKSLEEKEITPDQDIDIDLKMDEETGNKVFGNRNVDLSDFKENVKDIEKPSPSDDFE